MGVWQMKKRDYPRNIVSAEYYRTTGMGNKLFPWARAKILAFRLGCPVKKTVWFSPRNGALLRGGINYRNILSKSWLIGNFASAPDEMGWFDYFMRYRNLPRRFLYTLDDPVLQDEVDMHYCFKWDAAHNFADLWQHRDFLCQEFRRVVVTNRANYLATFDNIDFIAMNIRTGNDFKHKNSNEVGYYFTEIEWFAIALTEVRKIYGDLPAYIVSDGGVKQLGDLLAHSNVTLVETKTAADDLQILLKSKVLLGSGNSTFSAWASFLGGMDTYSSPETPFEHFRIVEPGNPQKILVL